MGWCKNTYVRFVIGILTLFVLEGCQECGCAESGILALLEHIQGDVKRDYGDTVNQWEEASVSSRFTFGDGVRTGELSKAVLRLTQGAIVLMDPSTQIRFSKERPKGKEQGISIEQGKIEVIAKQGTLRMDMGIGTAVIMNGSHVQIQKQTDELSVLVSIGKAEFISSENETLSLNAGDQISVSIGSAQLTLVSIGGDTEADSLKTQDSDVPIGDTDTSPTGDMGSISGSGDNGFEPKSILGGNFTNKNSPSVADFSVNAGESFVVYVQKPPVGVTFTFKSVCSDGAVVSLKGKKAQAAGRDGASLLVPTGTSRYQVHCIDSFGNKKSLPSALGRITVLRDRGRKRLPSKAPTTLVDADGRTYNVLYQNRLPHLSIRWPGAPKGDKYTLQLTHSSGKSKKISLSKPQYRFLSAKVREGTYQFRFTQDSTGRYSRRTTVKIRFDNAAPKAVLIQPKDGGFSLGEQVVVEGVALPGWRVVSPHGDISLDEHQRFTGLLYHRGTHRALVVKLIHPKRGVHYYVRRQR